MTGMDRHGGCSEAPKGSAVTPPRVQPFVAKNKQTNKQKNQERETDVGEREVFERLVAPFYVSRIFGFELRTFSLSGASSSAFPENLGSFYLAWVISGATVQWRWKQCLFLYQSDFPGICPPLGPEL